MSLGSHFKRLKHDAVSAPELEADSAVVSRKAYSVTRIAALNFIANNDLLWASGITYTVTLSIVPILALAFSVLKGLGGGQRLRELVDRYLALGAPQVTNHVMNYIGNVNAATLGSVGGVALLVTVISTLGTIEQAFNAIWQVPVGRSYLRRFADYLSVIFTVPVLLAAALTLTATYSNSIHMVPGLSMAVPFGMVWLGFLFLFVFFPYTTVRWMPALIGSFVSALLFQIAQWGYVYFQVGVGSYRAIYGALATIPIVLVWIYVSWLIILFGVELTFAAQTGRLRKAGVIASSLEFARYAALLALVRAAERFADPKLGVTPRTLAAELGLSEHEIAPIIHRLKINGLVIEARDEGDGAAPGGLFLSVDPARVPLGDLLRTLESGKAPEGSEPRIAALLSLVGELESEQLDCLTLSDLRDGLVSSKEMGSQATASTPSTASAPSE